MPKQHQHRGDAYLKVEESRIGRPGRGPRQQGFTAPRRPVEEDPLGGPKEFRGGQEVCRSEGVDDGLAQIGDEVIEAADGAPVGVEGGCIDQADGYADLVVGESGNGVHAKVSEDLMGLKWETNAG